MQRALHHNGDSGSRGDKGIWVTAAVPSATGVCTIYSAPLALRQVPGKAAKARPRPQKVESRAQVPPWTRSRARFTPTALSPEKGPASAPKPLASCRDKQ